METKSIDQIIEENRCWDCKCELEHCFRLHPDDTS